MYEALLTRLLLHLRISAAKRGEDPRSTTEPAVIIMNSHSLSPVGCVDKFNSIYSSWGDGQPDPECCKQYDAWSWITPASFKPGFQHHGYFENPSHVLAEYHGFAASVSTRDLLHEALHDPSLQLNISACRIMGFLHTDQVSVLFSVILGHPKWTTIGYGPYHGTFE
jgi:hypothetical protein